MKLFRIGWVSYTGGGKGYRKEYIRADSSLHAVFHFLYAWGRLRFGEIRHHILEEGWFLKDLRPWIKEEGERKLGKEGGLYIGEGKEIWPEDDVMLCDVDICPVEDDDPDDDVPLGEVNLGHLSRILDSGGAEDFLREKIRQHLKRGAPAFKEAAVEAEHFKFDLAVRLGVEESNEQR